ncbi:MAG: V-type ATP synthase subunit B, partial [Acidilobaceae archaeon]
MTLASPMSKKVLGAKGSLVFVKTPARVAYGELVEIEVDEDVRLGQVVSVDIDVTVVQVLGSSAGIGPGRATIKFLGEPLRAPVSLDMLGRVMDGLGRPIDEGPR